MPWKRQGVAVGNKTLQEIQREDEFYALNLVALVTFARILDVERKRFRNDMSFQFYVCVCVCVVLQEYGLGNSQRFPIFTYANAFKKCECNLC